MQRYFASIIDNNAILSDVDQNHLLNVMRSQIGTNIEIVFQQELFLATISSLSPLLIKVDHKINENHELNHHIVLYMSLLKGEKNDLVVQKATELGVSEIVFVRSEHSIGKIKEIDEKAKIERFKRIAKEASQQSKRNAIPLIDKIIYFDDINNSNESLKFIASLNNSISNKELEKCIHSLKRNDSIAVLIGPEGGWTKEEEQLAMTSNFVPISLGRSVLRAETAAFKAISVISFLLEK